VKGIPAFWDSSAVVPLFVREDATQLAKSYWSRYLPVVWWGTFVETHAAFRRLRREGDLTDEGVRNAADRLEAMRRSWKEILPGDELRELAVELLDAHPLYAADSLQLAASLIWCDRRPAKRTFICADQRLSRAAASIGFSVLGFPG